MSRPFSAEISQLKDTYEWSRRENVDRLAQVVGRCAHLPLVAVGSGGSFSAASYVAGLHETISGIPGVALTPLELFRQLNLGSEVAVVFLSASGKNQDVVSALRLAAVSEPSRLIALCMKAGSKLALVSQRYHYIDLFEFDLPTGRDGFLATNSLLATCMLFYRAYRDLGSKSSFSFPPLPRTYRQFIGLSGGASLSRDKRKASYVSLWQKNHLIVLYGPSTRAAAVDLESKFTEAALGTVQIADYRNFAHGRHHWLAKRSSETAVLAFASDEEQELAHRTTRLLPLDLPTVNVDIKARGALADLCALNEVFYIVASAGEVRGIDPGRPGVPPFGRKLYHLGAKTKRRGVLGLSSSEAIAISRKARADVSVLAQGGRLRRWREAYEAFADRLTKAHFGALVLDYDGTLCSQDDRFSGIGDGIAGRLVELLDSGVLLGIATGRGDSVRTDMRQVLPRRTWTKVVVGYHSGAELGELSDDDIPRQARPNSLLRSLYDMLRKDFRLKRVVECRLSWKQISLRLRPCASLPRVYDTVVHVVASSSIPEARTQCSAHSVDILAPGVSKLAVHDEVARILQSQSEGEDLAILCLGDRGRIPGNDAELLGTPFSLSVDKASPAPDTCWNLAPPGIRGVQAAAWYVDRFRLRKDGRFRIFLTRKKGTGCRS